jgi:hypothetical protein
MILMERDAAAALVGIATFSVWQAWGQVAPSLSELRESGGSLTMRTKLQDADILVGGMSLLVGTAMAIYTHDLSAMILMIFAFGIMSVWSHMVLNSESLREE